MAQLALSGGEEVERDRPARVMTSARAGERHVGVSRVYRVSVCARRETPTPRA